MKIIPKHTKPPKSSITIGIIGYGRFGKLLEVLFKKNWKKSRIKIYSQETRIDNKKFYTLQEVTQSDFIILAIPISAMQRVLKQIQKLVGKDSVIVDVCSVKIKPVEWMKKILGTKQQIIASHPMFGPDSTKNGVFMHNLNMMIFNISATKENYYLFLNFWKNMGVNMIEITPKKHDEYAAYTINYNHLMGRIGEIIGIKPTPIDTKGFAVIYNALKYVIKDTFELFIDMQKYNPYAKKMRTDVMEALKQIEQKISKKT